PSGKTESLILVGGLPGGMRVAAFFGTGGNEEFFSPALLEKDVGGIEGQHHEPLESGICHAIRKVETSVKVELSLRLAFLDTQVGVAHTALRVIGVGK